MRLQSPHITDLRGHDTEHKEQLNQVNIEDHLGAQVEGVKPTPFDFQVITQNEQLVIKMIKTSGHPVHTHPHSNTQTHVHRDSSASSCHGWSLLLIGGLQLSSQVLPAEEKHNRLNLNTSRF